METLTLHGKYNVHVYGPVDKDDLLTEWQLGPKYRHNKTGIIRVKMGAQTRNDTPVAMSVTKDKVVYTFNDLDGADRLPVQALQVLRTIFKNDEDATNSLLWD